MNAPIDTTLRDRFHRAQLQSIEADLDGEESLDESILLRLEKIAGEGSLTAQVHLARLYGGVTTFFCDAEYVLEDGRQDAAKARYWALTASGAEDYALTDLAEVLLKFDDPDCKLRALSLIVTAIAGQSEAADTAVSLLEEHFAGFDLEALVAARHAPAVLVAPAAPASPQNSLF